MSMSNRRRWDRSTNSDRASHGITLHFGAETVKISGRNLNFEVRSNLRLFAAIVRHRVPWIQEADEPTALEAPRDATVIEGIEMA